MNSERSKVLIIDDDKDVLSALRRMFINESFEVILVLTLHEAWKMINKYDIKVVMSDERMPDMTGTRFLELLKEEYPSIIRILFTGFGDLKVEKDAINKAGVFKFITKPWDVSQLKETIRDSIKLYDSKNE